MKLYEEEEKKGAGKTIVLFLLIICVIIVGILIYLITILAANREGNRSNALFINGESIEITPYLIIFENDSAYVMIEDFLRGIEGYYFHRGIHGSLADDRNRAYVRTGNEVIGFEGGIDSIYKTVVDSILDLAHFELESYIINEDNRLYINVRDIGKVFNMHVDYDVVGESVEIIVHTMEFMTEYYTEALYERGGGILLSTNDENRKAMIHGLIVVSRGGVYGVLDENFNRVVEFRYSSIIFEEYTGNFIVEMNNRVGIIDNEENVIIDPHFDSMRIINHSPLLYEVQVNNQFGIVTATGDELVPILYERFGGRGGTVRDGEPVLVIPNVIDDDAGIVAVREGGTRNN